MRLVGNFQNEKEAFAFSCFLLKEGIENLYEPSATSEGENIYRLWVYDEDEYQTACDWYDYYLQHPEDVKFREAKTPPPAPPPISVSDEFKIDGQGKTLKIVIRKKHPPFSFALTYLFLMVCVALFLWNDVQEAHIVKTQGELALEVGLTPLQRGLLFDYPSAMKALDELVLSCSIKSFDELKKMPLAVQEAFKRTEAIPSWKGLSELLLQWKKTGSFSVQGIPMFEKIQEGQVWRLFTPCLLHRDFLHILFNMAWLWILGKQIEERLKKGKMLVLIVVIGIISNTAQYLVSGPYFLGFSGIVVGLAGFIWSRQKAAPWEGYPLQKPTVLFILFFVLAMFLLEVITLGLQFFAVTDLSANIANTAHMVGGLVGLCLGRLQFFSRRAT
jgi:GlpG protein